MKAPAGHVGTAILIAVIAFGAPGSVQAQSSSSVGQPATAPSQQAAVPLDQFPRDPLTIATPRGLHILNVWIADTEARRTQGLMFVRALPDDTGMLFTYGSSRPIALWMKNTFIPLDIVFVRANGRIARIVANALPESLARIESGESVLAALELKGGTAARLGLSPGAQVIHPLFTARP